jgi:hypothetical protein
MNRTITKLQRMSVFGGAAIFGGVPVGISSLDIVERVRRPMQADAQVAFELIGAIVFSLAYIGLLMTFGGFLGGIAAELWRSSRGHALLWMLGGAVAVGFLGMFVAVCVMIPRLDVDVAVRLLGAGLIVLFAMLVGAFTGYGASWKVRSDSASARLP